MKKIAVNTVETFLKEQHRDDGHTETFAVGDNTFEVSFRTVLTISEKSAFINRVLSGCFDVTGRFRPEYVTPMIRATILQMCTDVPALTLKGIKNADGKPTLDLDAMNELYMAMGLDHLNNTGYQELLDEMIHLCGQAIDWKRSAVLSEHNTDSALRDLLDALTAKIESIDMTELMQYASQLSEVTKGMSEDTIVNKLIDLKDYQSINDG